MSLSPEQRAARAAAIGAVTRLLHESWEEQKSQPLPEHITRLLAQLDNGETSSSISA
jgi:hypothetical protein